jgi:hypothetical protein
MPRNVVFAIDLGSALYISVRKKGCLNFLYRGEIDEQFISRAGNFE